MTTKDRPWKRCACVGRCIWKRGDYSSCRWGRTENSTLCSTCRDNGCGASEYVSDYPVFANYLAIKELKTRKKKRGTLSGSGRSRYTSRDDAGRRAAAWNRRRSWAREGVRRYEKS